MEIIESRSISCKTFAIFLNWAGWIDGTVSKVEYIIIDCMPLFVEDVFSYNIGSNKQYINIITIERGILATEKH